MNFNALCVFYSKRESTAETGEARLQLVEMPADGGIVFKGYTGDSDSDLPPPPPPIAQYSGQYTGDAAGYPPPPPPVTSHDGGIPQELRQPGDGHPQHPPSQYPQQWYESGIKSGAEPSSGNNPQQIRQQNPPRTPVFENPPLPFVQQDPPAQQMYSHTETQQMTVTKFQSYVEVSKPFEMSDFYKYSEKLRKQRTVERRQQKLEAVLAGQAIPSPQGARGQGDGSGAPSPAGGATARYTGYHPGSGATSPSQGSASASASPAPHQRNTSRSASPYTASPASPTPGIAFGGARPGPEAQPTPGSAIAFGGARPGPEAQPTPGSAIAFGGARSGPGCASPTPGYPRTPRGPAAASYGIHSTSTAYSSASTGSGGSYHQMSYQSSSSTVVAPPTKQIVYQPPAPQTCTPITQSPNTTGSNSTTPNR